MTTHLENLKFLQQAKGRVQVVEQEVETMAD